MQNVTILGLGYIGFPTALLLANSGLTVTGFDIDARKIKSLQNGKLFFEENGLQKLFNGVQKKKTFLPTTTLKHSSAYIVAVPTPASKGSADLTYVLSAIDLIEGVFKDGDLIIIESTIAPRDCNDIIIPKIKKWNKIFLFAHCPERAIPGNTLHEMVYNDRIIGGFDQKSREQTKNLYSKFVKGNLFLTDPITAATCKVMENTYRSVNIALANEFALIARDLDFNVWQAIELSNKHPRVNIHQPGPGVGGHCIPIDPWFFIDPKKTSESLIEKSLIVNENMAKVVVNEVISLINNHKIKNPAIGLLGYAYKKNVNDSRETPSQKIIDLLINQYKVKINDDFIKSDEFDDLETILSNSNVIILTTDHDYYKKINFAKYPNIKFVYDTRNLFTKNNISNKTKLYKLGVRNF